MEAAVQMPAGRTFSPVPGSLVMLRGGSECLSARAVRLGYDPLPTSGSAALKAVLYFLRETLSSPD